MQITSAMEAMTGNSFPADMRDEFLEGGGEIELVRSVLEDIMTVAYDRMASVLESRPELGDFRTAAYYLALNRIAEAYKAIGI